MTTKKLVMNACLAGLWAGLAALQVSGGEFSKAALFAAGAAAIRGVVGYVAGKFGASVPVDV